MRRRVLAATVALLAAAVLAGCAAIPSSGAVNAGNPAAADEQSRDFDIIVPGPQPGATQREILDGFINAAKSPADNYRVARQFLSQDFAGTWQADASATIDLLPRVIEPVDDSSMQVEATPVASLGAAGQYELQDSSTPVPLTYHFVQDDGEWRISEAPAGLLIDETSFELVFREQTLYFFDPDYRHLVPDLRWFAGRDSMQTSIVNALLAGPADWLEPGVVSAFPEGVQLSPASVPVSGREASVNLSGAAVDDVVTVQRMKLQLEASLGSVLSIDGVALALDDAVQDVPTLANPPDDDLRIDPRSVVYDGTVFGYLSASGDGIEQIPGLSAQVEALQPTGAALGVGGESAAVRSAAGVFLVRAGEDALSLDPRANLVVPAIDSFGGVWSVPADSPGNLVWYAPDGSTSIPMLVPWSGTSIAAIDVSRDGTRIVALLGDGARTHFVAASIERSTDGAPLALGPVPLQLDDVAGTPLDVAWLDSNTVASLTALPDGGTRVITQQLGGTYEPRQGPEGGIALDGGNSEGDLKVLTQGGDLYAQSGVGWQVRAPGIRFVAAQQAG